MRKRGAQPGNTHALRHGEGYFNNTTPEYRSWHGAKARCYTVSHKSYSEYGARGITVCEKWKNNYLAFLEDMGRKPAPEYSLDRIDNNGNYEPSNCRWATKAEQRANQRPRKKRICQ